MESVNDQQINDEPEKFFPVFNPVGIMIDLLAVYGWWIIGGLIAFVWIYNKSQPILTKWKNQREDAKYHKDPDIQIKRLEAIAAVRARQQQSIKDTAKEYQEKEKAREKKKRQEFINRNRGMSSGVKLGSNPDYFPLCGTGSGGYKAQKKSKCPGRGCG